MTSVVIQENERGTYVALDTSYVEKTNGIRFQLDKPSHHGLGHGYQHRP